MGIVKVIFHVSFGIPSHSTCCMYSPVDLGLNLEIIGREEILVPKKLLIFGRTTYPKSSEILFRGFVLFIIQLLIYILFRFA